MTLYSVIKNLEAIALTMPNIKSAKDGNIYDLLNSDPAIEYAAFVVTQNVHRQTEMFDYYNLTLFYVDRLNSDMESNRLMIQSHAKQVLGNIIRVFCDRYDVDLPLTINYTPFTQRFLDETAGQFVQVEFEIPVDNNCYEEFEDE